MSAIIHLIGITGRDSEMRYSPEGTAITNLSVATNFGKKVKGEWENHTNWYRVTLYGALAEKFSNLEKGTRVYVVGRFAVNEYDKKDGTRGYSLDITAMHVESLSPKKSQNDESANDSQVSETDDLPF